LFFTSFTFELKIILKSINFKVAVLLSFAVLIAFIVANMLEIQDIKDNDIARFERARIDALAFQQDLQDVMEIYTEWLEENYDDPHYMHVYMMREEQRWAYDFFNELYISIVDLIDALRTEDYKRAFEQHHLLNESFVRLHDFMNTEQGFIIAVMGVVAEGRNLSNRFYDQYNFTRYLLENNIEPLYENDMKPFNFIYQLFQKWLPLYFFIVAAIVIYPAISKEAGNKSLVFTLTKPTSRAKLLFAKYIAAVSSILIAVFGPILIVSVLLGLINGFDSPRYPVLSQTDAYSSIDPLYNVQSRNELYYYAPMPEDAPPRFAVVEPSIITPEARASAFASVPGRLGVSSYNFFGLNGRVVDYRYDERLGFISMFEFLLLTIPFLIVCTLFTTAVCFLLALILRKEIFVIFFLLVLAVVNIFRGQPITNLSFFEQLNPLLSANAAQIISGRGGITALGALSVTLIVTAIALTISLLLFRRLEIK
jgi:ABC-type transport system involved in multi-copper enzyme maturation permease subunit